MVEATFDHIINDLQRMVGHRVRVLVRHFEGAYFVHLAGVLRPVEDEFLGASGLDTSWAAYYVVSGQAVGDYPVLFVPRSDGLQRLEPDPGPTYGTGWSVGQAAVLVHREEVL